VVASEIPVSIDADDLLDPASAGQLVILKNLEMQFRASGLRMKIVLKLKSRNSAESLQNVIRDLGLSGVSASWSIEQESPGLVKMVLVAPDGTRVREWRDFVGPAEIGLAVRSVLGGPFYSEMESEAH